MLLLGSCSANANVGIGNDREANVAEGLGESSAAEQQVGQATSVPEAVAPSASGEATAPLQGAVLPSSFIVESRQPPQEALTAADIDLPELQAEAMLALPVTEAPLELIVSFGERILRFVSLATNESAVLIDRPSEAWSWSTRGSVWLESEPMVLDRWRLDRGELSRYEITSGDRIGSVIELQDGAIAIVSFRLNAAPPLDYLFVFEATGELRCELASEFAIRLADHGVFEAKPDGQVTFEWARMINTDRCEVGPAVPSEAMFGGIHHGALFSAEHDPDAELQFQNRIVRHQLNEAEWVESLRGEELPISRALHFGGESVWAKGLGQLYRLSADTLAVEGVWELGSEFDLPQPHFTADAAWVAGSTEVTRIDLSSNAVERYERPIDGSNFSRFTPHGLLFGRPGSGYFFSFELERFERLPDWLLMETTGADAWSAPAAG